MADVWAGKSLLVVDDSGTYRALLAHMLDLLGANVRLLENAGQFRDFIRSESVDLIVLDYRLPGVSGLELLAEFRQTCFSTPVVLITGESTLRTATEALTRGADGFLDKRHLSEGHEALGMALEQALEHRKGVLAQLELQVQRESFDSLLAHDLRSPVACASTALALYEEQGDEAALGVARRSLQRFFGRLDRYLAFSEMESQHWRMEMQECNLWELIHELFDSLRPLATAKEQSLVSVGPQEYGYLRADPLWLAHCLENLIGNAIKYTQEGGQIRVVVSYSDDNLTIEVEDNGPGIPEELRGQVFRRFFRAPGERLKVAGSGLGLSIASKVAEAHRGRLTFSPSSSGGATFRLCLPGSSLI